ncbi:hypothetical protein BC943DRAFT_272971 [Umbelopsis sp. AD052]|nr:hypothetical protein BC943DRAFT_272971 [Umbelopsis sp. AD052]
MLSLYQFPSLCNRCGLRWANDRLPNDQIVPLNFIPDQVRAHLSSKEPDSSSLSHAERSNSHTQTQRKSKSSYNTVVLENEQQGASYRKKFLDAGIYSNEHKAQSDRRSSKAVNSTREFTFKLPEYYGECLLAKEVDFRLSYDIMEAFRSKQIGKEAEEYKQKSLKPSPYTKIRSNIFVERKHARHNRKSPVCQCTIPIDGSHGCSEDCLNRMMFYECDAQTCPCGKLCSNQRFQHKEEVNDLRVFWTNGRGWGLQTLTDIKVGQLITEYRGEIISQRLCEERLRTVYKDTGNFYFLDYQNGEVIDAAAKGSDARFVNHSCDPNCHIEKWAIGGEVCVGVFASQDISAGSELFYDYNYTLIGSGVSQKCRCESTKCRGYMGRKASVRDHSSR